MLVSAQRPCAEGQHDGSNKVKRETKDMKVYKFGGASVRNAEGVRNLRNIIDDEQNLFIIVSAMGKTTNALERVFEGVQRGDREKSAAEIARLREYHAAIIDDLWHGPTRLERVEALFAELDRVAAETQYRAADAELWYDTIVAFGELLSTTVVSEYLASAGVANHWVDMRRALVTQQRHKDASVDIDASAFRLLAEVEGAAETIFVGQGFIGGAPDGTTTTLGREGSDYSAAVVANILGAESMSVWKDVDGVLNADPKTFPDAEQIKELNYLDTIELAYSGAQIIHPKTIKPLQNKNIPLYVRPFGDKRKPGTVIRGTSAPVTVPILIPDGAVARFFVRAGREVRHDLLAARTLPHQDQSDPQFGGQSGVVRRQFVAYRRSCGRIPRRGLRRDEGRGYGAAHHPGLYRRAAGQVRLYAESLRPPDDPVHRAHRPQEVGVRNRRGRFPQWFLHR